MNRIITIIVLATFFPMQLYAVDFSGFNDSTSTEYFVPNSPDRKPEPKWDDPRLSNKIMEEPPKSAENSGTNWWLWGGLGLAAVAGGLIALAAGGGKSSGSSGGGVGGTTTVTGSW